MSNNSYKAKMRALRPFVAFNFDLRKPLKPHEKRKITIYYEELKKVSGRNNQIYRPKTEKTRKAAQRYANVKGKDFKAFPIPTPEKAKVTVNKAGNIKLVTESTTVNFIPFNPLIIATGDAEKIYDYVYRLGNNSFKYILVFGAYRDYGARTIKSTANRAVKLAMQYGEAGQFLIGMDEIAFNNQDDLEQYMSAKTQARKKRRNATKKKKRA